MLLLIISNSVTNLLQLLLSINSIIDIIIYINVYYIIKSMITGTFQIFDYQYFFFTIEINNDVKTNIFENIRSFYCFKSSSTSLVKSLNEKKNVPVFKENVFSYKSSFNKPHLKRCLVII